MSGGGSAAPAWSDPDLRSRVGDRAGHHRVDDPHEVFEDDTAQYSPDVPWTPRAWHTLRFLLVEGTEERTPLQEVTPGVRPNASPICSPIGI